MTVHKFSTQFTKQNSSDNLPSYLQTNIIAQMLSIRGEGGIWQIYAPSGCLVVHICGSLCGPSASVENKIRQQIDIDDMQFGFMKGKGTTDAIVRQMQQKFRAKGKKHCLALWIWKKLFIGF